jgi:prepilin-type N-terminal cleavage/methylation domain-containing protein
MRRADERGFSLIELMVSLVVLSLVMTGLASLLIQNARINKAQQMRAEVQGNARNTLSMVVQKLRSAGWDPTNAGLDTVTLDADLGDDVSEIEVFADLDEDGDTDATGEQMLIRHTGAGAQVVWRETADAGDPFIVLATNISNDADGDGTIEPMFVPDANPPTRIGVTVTAQSPTPDPTSGDFIRYTVRSDVVLRKEL